MENSIFQNPGNLPKLVFISVYGRKYLCLMRSHILSSSCIDYTNKVKLKKLKIIQENRVHYLSSQYKVDIHVNALAQIHTQRWQSECYGFDTPYWPSYNYIFNMIGLTFINTSYWRQCGVSTVSQQYLKNYVVLITNLYLGVFMIYLSRRYFRRMKITEWLWNIDYSSGRVQGGD